MTGNEIRRSYLEFFERNGHRLVASSPLVPMGDPTLLFANAGMNQFKDVFLGLEAREYRRATTCQKCVRAGGKHNDLEMVGRTRRHHTFFEMLGNFSFGDYFKREAIAFAWELTTGLWQMPPDRLYFSVHTSDDEAFALWQATAGAGPERIARFDEDNFWAMGDTGPCGPCSELFYDLGPAASEEGHADCRFPCDCGRYVEFWNLVFMQYDRNSSGEMKPLPKPSVDTGAGLERLAAVLQGKISNFDTDLLRPLVDAAGELAGKAYGEAEATDVSLRILADHSRATTFLVADGVLPSNEGRGYVLRKIMRRAIDHGRRLGLDRPFLYQMAGEAAELMREPYPEVAAAINRIATVIRSEEEKYGRLVVPAVRALEKRLEEGPKESGRPVIRGTDLFYAYDTLGLRPDFVLELADQRHWSVAEDSERAFEAELDGQRERAKASWKGVTKEAAQPVYAKLAEAYRTDPDFYFGTTARDCKVLALVTKKGLASEVAAGAECEVVLDRTSIYAESGGQVADTGWLEDNELGQELAEVRGAYYPVHGLVAHRVTTKQPLAAGDRVATVADPARRDRTRRNHTATHLLHAALRNVLGTHVKQAGSLVAPDRLRFDFSHFAPLDREELAEIEQQVNEEILKNLELRTDITSLEQALGSGALAFFGDKYPELNVRVVTIPDAAVPRGFYSKELCGGTHVRRTGDIGAFKLLVEQSVAAGVRRLEAITGEAAVEDYRQTRSRLEAVAARLGVEAGEVIEAIERLEQHARQLEKQLEAMKRKSARSKLDDLAGQVRTVKDVKVIAARLADVDRETMRELADSLRQKLGSVVVVLGTAEDGKVALVAAVTKDLSARLHAGKIVQAVARQVGGSGGGRPDLAEAGGKDTQGLETAIGQVYGIVEQML
ncbi:MAG TPA: alanine--tRNA ligase [Candidatus Acidoferrales bacterium]|nr:alanine--tRNA ligase [Candidatus Acidoferrales bacterium]